MRTKNLSNTKPVYALVAGLVLFGSNAIAYPVYNEQPSACDAYTCSLQTIPNPFVINDGLWDGTEVIIDDTSHLSTLQAYEILGPMTNSSGINLLDGIDSIRITPPSTQSIARDGERIRLSATFARDPNQMRAMLLVARLQRALINESDGHNRAYSVQGQASVAPTEVLSTLRKIRALSELRNINSIKQVVVLSAGARTHNSLEGQVLTVTHTITRNELLNLLPAR